MTEPSDKIDYSKTLYLPQTEFPMRAGLPEKEPLLVKRWQQMDLYKKLRASAAGRQKYVLHDGPPYANGNIHIGHALNKILKDVITRSFQMRGYDSNYVPGWDCHGLPIEWKIEEKYRAAGKNKDEVPVNEFRKECRDFAAALDQGAGRRVPAARRRRRFRQSLHDHGLPRRGAHRRRAVEVRHVRPALSRLQAGDVERGRAHRAGRGRGRVCGLRERYGLGEVSGGTRLQAVHADEAIGQRS